MSGGLSLHVPGCLKRSGVIDGKAASVGCGCGSGEATTLTVAKTATSNRESDTFIAMEGGELTSGDKATKGTRG